MPRLLIYGSYGYVGSLIAREADDRGLDLLLAGRDHDELSEQSADLDRPARGFPLSDPDVVDEGLADVECVLNCAGPFSNTAEPLVEGCLRTGTDYLDVTGEIPVIETVAAYDDVATDAGVTLLPSVGFSSVPMDCLAAHLADRLPDATELALGVYAIRVPSIGTIKTVIEGVDTGGRVRRNGELVHVPAAWRSRTIEFESGPRPTVTMPLGDVSTAHYTTGIPDGEVYAFMPQPARSLLGLHKYLAPLLATTPVQRISKLIAGLVRDGPSERARERGSAQLWGEASNDDERVVSRMQTPDPYVVTTRGAVRSAERVLAGDADPGYQTPAGAFGTDFVFDIDDVEGFFDERPAQTT